jgi:hypothetical protein
MHKNTKQTKMKRELASLLPEDVVYHILELSGHGNMRKGFMRDNGTVERCKFIFRLTDTRLSSIRITPIHKFYYNHRVRLRINDTKVMDLRVDTYPQNTLNFQILVWDDPHKYFYEPCKFLSGIDSEMPIETVVHNEHIIPTEPYPKTL